MSDLVPAQPAEEVKEMSIVEHIGELRYRITRAAIGIFVGMIFCWGFSDYIFDIVRLPIQSYLPQGGLIYTAPIDKFMAHIKLAFICGVLLSAPFWLYHLWKFISPALYRNERRFALGFIFFGTLQFLLGVVFTYFIVLPMAFKFLMTFGGDVDKPMITIDHYLGFFTQTSLVFGLAFEMPVIISFLGLVGAVSERFLKENRRYAVVTITALSAVLAPPDALSMILLMMPLWVLYEVSILVVGFFERRKAAEAFDSNF
ncbi:MAG: twin arginine-targeting protein translocase TatC [Bdellovibrionales bacterium RIFCSPHIGHO2_01_FULL_40_29]|nr:MAG: twin arginine-targeting protein translocase TatC [Bdellovibrionales bacterium RIFCSPHIGHO2_01_FULL_40_29]OFZ34715.1 MAG: twin arginine-targeting protein translocase TatC [Bdellovibrionales bacterium RIFCSPHIGHO2_02_FULL_40_15]